MNSVACMSVFWAAMLLVAPSLQARDILLGPGESFQLGDDRVTCQAGPGETTQPLRTTDCQHWDDFTKTCLHERTVLSLNGLECVEECQQWDRFSNRCLYATRCEFVPNQRLFVRTYCADFDSHDEVCRRTAQDKITDPRRVGDTRPRGR